MSLGGLTHLSSTGSVGGVVHFMESERGPISQDRMATWHVLKSHQGACEGLWLALQHKPDPETFGHLRTQKCGFIMRPELP